MKTISLTLDEELDAALDEVCAEEGRAKTALLAEIVRHYVETARAIRGLQDPALSALYVQLAAEDVSLAEQGIWDYQRLLKETDQT